MTIIKNLCNIFNILFEGHKNITLKKFKKNYFGIPKNLRKNCKKKLQLLLHFSCLNNLVLSKV